MNKYKTVGLGNILIGIITILSLYPVFKINNYLEPLIVDLGGSQNSSFFYITIIIILGIVLPNILVGFQLINTSPDDHDRDTNLNRAVITGVTSIIVILLILPIFAFTAISPLYNLIP